MPVRRPFLLLLLLLPLAWLALRPDDGGLPLVRSRIVMGTVVEITVIEAAAGDPGEAVDRAFAEMERLEKLMSPHVPGSDLDRLARSEGPVEVAPETAEVLALGLEVARASGGAFDLSLGRLKELWGVETDQPRVPGPEAIRNALEGIGPEALELDGLEVRKSSPGLRVDLGGIAKGYAVDRAVAVLASGGVASAAVNAGGDLRLLGDRYGRPWRIGIQHPRQPDGVLATLSLSDTAVVTSGDYERFFLEEGRRYHHIFDPRSGFPAAARAVTVVAASAARADALATAVFVLGPGEGLRFLEEQPDAEGMIVDADGALQVTDGLRERLE